MKRGLNVSAKNTTPINRRRHIKPPVYRARLICRNCTNNNLHRSSVGRPNQRTESTDRLTSIEEAVLVKIKKKLDELFHYQINKLYFSLAKNILPLYDEETDQL